MAHYTPLQTTVNTDEDFRDPDLYPTDENLQKTQYNFNSFGFWVTLLISGLSLLSSIALNISIPSIQPFSVNTTNITSLRKLTPYPNLEMATKLTRHKNSWFTLISVKLIDVHLSFTSAGSILPGNNGTS